jgi:hypothetical protein
VPWTDEEWRGFCAVVDQGWPGEFDETAREAWRILLVRYEPADVGAALSHLIAEGHRFRPSVSELVAAMRRDPTRPTFEEALALMYGPGGILSAKPQRDGGVLRYDSERQRRALYDQAALQRAGDMHPLVASFVTRYGLDRLRALPVDDPEWGGKHQRDLEQAWNRHVEATDGREVAALAAGAPRGELARLDPFAALGLPRDRPQIEAEVEAGARAPAADA